jgi:hypothetical protein
MERRLQKKETKNAEWKKDIAIKLMNNYFNDKLL